ncbi:hypothetical protein NPIL_701291 [Nephila pilipes]|uniref:Uncharacterized protein n=1 Tax=Nephila pilipes TaxID=299642 RepID=A0A8X6MXJ0_NEPPI|nr:hypothetical protein NPIL_701291 [Nephila pilipes]
MHSSNDKKEPQGLPHHNCQQTWTVVNDSGDLRVPDAKGDRYRGLRDEIKTMEGPERSRPRARPSSFRWRRIEKWNILSPRLLRALQHTPMAHHLARNKWENCLPQNYNHISHHFVIKNSIEVE